jgi:hypothetical protein
VSPQPLSRDVVALRLSGLGAMLEPSTVPASELRWRYRQAAAVLSYFDPNTLKPLDGDHFPDGARLHLVEDIPPGTENKPLWILSTSVRKEALKRLGTQNEMRQALQANPPVSQDPYQRALETYIQGTQTSLDGSSMEELRSTSEVVDWLRGLIPNLPSRAELRHRVDLANLLEPFRQLSREGRFFGRAEDLDSIDEYLANSATSLYEDPPLYVHGPGGIGKSALLAHMILRCAEAGRPARNTFVHIDLDLTGLIRQPLQLLMEAARQLAYQNGELAARWNVLKTQWSDRLASASVEQTQHDAALSPRVRGDLLRQFRDNLRRHEGTLLVTLDSFVEGQQRPSLFGDALWRMLNELQGLCPEIRVVMSGRDLPTAFAVRELPLGGLDTAAAEELMETLGVRDPDVVRTITEQVNGNPLCLRLAAEVIGRDFERGIALSGPRDFLPGTLYHRVLSKIQDADVRQLALYSLVLRRLSVDLLAQILARPCDVAIRSTEHAERLFVDVRRSLLLARVSTDGSLHHPLDVRRTVLEFLRHEDRERVDAIHESAVEYYSHASDAGSRAEELYHRLSLGEEAPEPGVPQEAYESLRTTMGDLPATGQKSLARPLRVTLDQEALARAEMIQQEIETAKDVRELVDQTRVAEALERLRGHNQRSPGSPLFLLEAEVHRRLGRTTDARRTVQKGLEAAAPLGDSSVLVDLLAFLANLDQETPARAARRLEEAYLMAQRLHDIERTIKVGVAILGLPGASFGDLGGELRAAFFSMSDAWIAQRPSLMHRLAAVLGNTHSDILKRVIRVTGLPHPIPASQLKTLADLIDVSITEPIDHASGREEPASLVGAPRPGASSDEWLGYLSQAAPQDLRLLVTSILEASSSNDAFVRITRILKGALDDSDASAIAAPGSKPIVHPFFETLEYPWVREDASALHQALYRAIPDPQRIDLYYHQAGENLLPLNLNKPPDVIWKEVLDKLTSRKVLRISVTS